MIFLLKNGASKKDIKAIDKKLYNEKTSNCFDAKKYNGVLSLKEDALSIQLNLRNK
ncbi:hypothetical protein GCM10027049_20710 [Mucilaginibacter puniceus]